MKVNPVLRLLTLTFFVAVLCVPATAQQMPTPSEEHKVIMQDVGEWTFKGKMITPDGFQAFTGEETVNAVGGFWTVSNYSSDIMGGLKGSATIGFDPKTQKYVGTWVDSFQSTPTHMKGTYDKGSKTMTFETSGTGMDGKPMKGRIIIKYKDENSHSFTMMHKDPTGQTDKFVNTMEMSYTRKAKK